MRLTEDGRECLDFYNESYGPCDNGPVMYHPSIAGTGTMIPRCEKHYQALLDRNDKYNEVMPDSDIAPSWFDPTAAGERWEADY